MMTEADYVLKSTSLEEEYRFWQFLHRIMQSADRGGPDAAAALRYSSKQIDRIQAAIIGLDVTRDQADDDAHILAGYDDVDLNPEHRLQTTDCPTCDGTGHPPHASAIDELCPECGGTGNFEYPIE